MGNSLAQSEHSSESRVIEVNLDYSSWYWVYNPDQPSRLRFAVHQGLLIQVDDGKRCVGVDLTDRTATQWLAQASEKQRALVRTVKIGAQGDFGALEMLPNVESLEANGLSRDEMEWLCDLERPLKNIHLSWCPDLDDISPLRQCPSLIRLHLSDCPELGGLTAVGNLSELCTLEVVNCDDIWEIDEVAGAKKLKRVVFRNCENIHRLNPLAVLPEIRTLDLSRSTNVADLSPVQNMNSLISLDLSNCMRVRDVSPLQDLASLRILRLFGCNGLNNLRPLYNLSNLQEISLPNNIKDGDFLGMCVGFSGLIQLDLRNCSTVTDLSPLQRLQGLKKLSLAGCSEIADIAPLAKLEKLAHLDLACCTKIDDISPLKSLNNLKELYIDGCPDIPRKQVQAFHKAQPQCTIHKG